jgi:hypothetical protein
MEGLASFHCAPDGMEFLECLGVFIICIDREASDILMCQEWLVASAVVIEEGNILNFNRAGAGKAVKVFQRGVFINKASLL